MKGDFTRWTYNKLRHYREVNMQQGRTQLDADWNEQNSINFHYETAALQDIIGRSGTPIDSLTGYSDGFQIRLIDLYIAPTTGTSSSQFTATGFGFAAGETVTLTLDGDSRAVVATATASSTGGSIESLITLPSTVAIGTHTITAKGATSGMTATADLDLTSGPSIELTPLGGIAGVLDGFGFEPGEKVTFVISPDSGASIASRSADSSGAFFSFFSFPASTSPGPYTITATGASGDTATATFDLTSTSLAVLYASEPAGTMVEAMGFGFTSGENISFALSGKTGVSIPAPTWDGDIFLLTSFTLPASTPPGSYTLTATGETSGNTASANLFVVPYLPSLGYTIKHGHYYVDGILCENDSDVASDLQPDLPLLQAPGGAASGSANAYDALSLAGYSIDPSYFAAASGLYLAYLDVWERHLTYLDDPEMREVALLGPDTATRTKIVWQVKLLPVDTEGTGTAQQVPSSSGVGTATGTTTGTPTGTVVLAESNAAAGTPAPTREPAGCDAEFPEWTALVAPSTGRLTARSKPTAPTGDPCEVPDEAGYTSLQNQLYRVEIHNGGKLGGKSSSTPTFKWSRDNGIVVSAISNIDDSDATATVLTVNSTGKNPNLSFLNNMWVEVTSDVNDLWGLPGSLALVTAVNTPGQNTITIDPTSVVGAAITDASYPPDQNPKVRRWDWDQTTPTPPPYPLVVHTPTGNDGYIELEDGVQVRFSDGTYHTGDYWLIPARTATADVDWPEVVKGVDWSSVPSGGSDAKTLATFLIQRYGLDGIKASDFALSGTTEIDGSYVDPSGVSHVLSIALNDDQSVATLTVDGIVGAEIPVLTESDGSLSLQCGFPEALGPEGITHYYARLALFEFSPTIQTAKECVSMTLVEAEGGPNTASLLVGVSPSYLTIPIGGTGTATVTVSYTIGGNDAPFTGQLGVSIQPAGPTGAFTPDAGSVTMSTSPATATLTVTVPSSTAADCYYAQITCSGQGVTSNTVYLTISVPPAFVSPILYLTDCRLLFPALTDLPRIFYVSGDGQMANAGSYALPSPLMVASSTGRVRFTIVSGAGTLTNPDATGSPVTGTGAFLDVTPGVSTPDASIYAEMEHIAWCSWVVDQSTSVQVVRADALDGDGNITDPCPIYFNAFLPSGTAQAAGSTPAATTGVINYLLQPGSAVQLGPFNHYLTVDVPPAILLAFELEYAHVADYSLDQMADANYFLLEADKAASASLSLPPMPVATAVGITDTQFYVDIASDIAAPSGASLPNYNLRWWAIPATSQQAQTAAGVLVNPPWIQSGSTSPIQIQGAYFNASATSIIVSYTSGSGGTSVPIQTIQPVPANGSFTISNFQLPSGLSGWVVITATDGTNTPSTTLYVVSITLAFPGDDNVVVSGTGFAPFGAVSIQLDGSPVQLTQSVKTDASGNFSSAQFAALPATFAVGGTVTATVGAATASASISAQGEGKYYGPGTPGADEEKAASRRGGSAVGSRRNSGATGQAGGPAASAKPTAPQISLSVPTGPVGTDVVISGTGFSGDSNVVLAFNQKILPEATTNASGSFTASFRVPQTGSGSHTIFARDDKSGKTVRATFKVP